MKLRFHSNTLRLRLNQSDVAQLSARGRVEETVAFAGSPLVYSIESAGSAESIAASFENGRILVTLPAAAARLWIDSDQTSLENPRSSPRILVEKDFQCVHRASDDDTGGFPNPLA